MKTTKLLATLLLFIAAAFNASAKVKIGSLYYNLDSSTKTAEVTYLYYDSTDNQNYVSGDLVIPSTVEYDGTTYSVTSIGSYAFRECSGLTSVTIPNSVTSIGDGTFAWCSGLTSVTIPNSVTEIGWYAFSYCTSLTSVTIPNSVTYIGGEAFYKCTSLTSVHITDIAAWCKINFGGYLGSYYSNPLYCAGKLYLNGTEVKDLVIPNSVTSIGNCAFAFCTSMTSVTIPNSVTSIGNYAFQGCTSLTSVTIPNSVTEIGSKAFYGCTNLSTVYSYAATPPLMENTDIFSDETYQAATLYVPKGCVRDYKVASGWSQFYNIVEGNYAGVDDLIADGAAAEIVGYYNLQGVCVITR